MGDKCDPGTSGERLEFRRPGDTGDIIYSIQDPNRGTCIRRQYFTRRSGPRGPGGCSCRDSWFPQHSFIGPAVAESEFPQVPHRYFPLKTSRCFAADVAACRERRVFSIPATL